MHGRLKVKTTAEQQEAKRKEREKKLQLYTAGSKRAFQKRKNEEYDEEALSITGDLLSANPDFYTLWNFRREIFLHFQKEKTEDELQKLLEGELQFLEGCLRVNPKSYGSWHHRCFVMLHMPTPQWQHELHLCNKYLEHDERNFHCWDYRRFVVKHHQVSPEAEFEFTTDKISANFSNFSSWHYRSQLLPVLHPDPGSWAGIEEKVMLQELELVQNAFFTDPNDQSAWFYHMWLLGAPKQKLDIAHLQILRKNLNIYVTLTRPVKVGEECELKVTLNSAEREGEWSTPDPYGYSNTWVWSCCEPLNLDEQYEVCVTLHCGGEVTKKKCHLVAGEPEATVTSCHKNELTETLRDILTQELDNCSQLHELEPDNKWTMLTIVSLMQRLDPETYESQIVQYIDKLTSVDPMRANYYQDLKSKIIIGNRVRSANAGVHEIDLSSSGLSCLSNLEGLVHMNAVNLANNAISHLRGINVLQSTRCLNLNNNAISSLDGVHHLPNLEILMLEDNNIKNTSELASLQSCTSLRQLDVSGNPLCESETWKMDLARILPHIIIS